MKIGCILIFYPNRNAFADNRFNQESKTNEVILLYLEREFGCTWRLPGGIIQIYFLRVVDYIERINI